MLKVYDDDFGFFLVVLVSKNNLDFFLLDKGEVGVRVVRAVGVRVIELGRRRRGVHAGEAGKGASAIRLSTL